MLLQKAILLSRMFKQIFTLYFVLLCNTSLHLIAGLHTYTHTSVTRSVKLEIKREIQARLATQRLA